MTLSLPKELVTRQAALRRSDLPPVRHVQTPTGSWGFLKDITLEDSTRETTALIDHNDVAGVQITRFDAPLNATTRKLLVEKLMTLVPRERDALTGTHFASITGGLLVRVTGLVTEPIVLHHTFAPGTAAFRNTLVLLEPGAECILIETFEGNPRLMSHVAEVFAAANSHLTYAATQTLTGQAISRRAALVGKDATIDWFELAANSQESFSRTTSGLAGEGAATKEIAVYLGGEGSRVDVAAKAEHHAPRTTSELAAKGVLAGDAKAVYEGVLAIGEAAAKSSAFQRQDVLLLSEEAESKASPALYISNNDVRCTHAATTGRLDSEKLFYLMARGLPQQEAERLLVKAFVWPALELLGTAASCKVIPYAEPVIERFAATRDEQRTRTIPNAAQAAPAPETR